MGLFQRIDSTGSAQIHIGPNQISCVMGSKKKQETSEMSGTWLFDACTIILLNWMSALITMVCEAVGEQ